MRASPEAVTPDLQPRPSAASSLARLSLPVNKTSSGVRSSATWTSTSGDLGALSDTDEIGDRQEFVEEYNRIAKKYGIRPLVPDNHESLEAIGVLPKRRWWSRTFRRTSSQSTENSVRRQRSTSHVMSHLTHPKRDSLKDQDLQGLVRLCGKSFLYLPPEYAPGSLILPTCFRATAQYLVQHAPETRGVFRIPGSVRVVNELYEFYCADQAGGDVANTVRSPNLPFHINAGIHDVASCFKKFLAGLPGGILGSLSLFDALVAINSQLYCDPEFSRTKQTKIRARLIALAVGTLRSQYRRELICAVFGLLCLLGRAAETTPREDEFGRPLPTSDLMGYNALGIVFGPLLVGDILGSHAVKLSDPTAGLFLVAASPSPKSKKERKKSKEPVDEPQGQQAFLDVDRIHVANDITEMLITNWRDVVRQMRNMDGGMSILRHHSRTSVSDDEPRRSSSLLRSAENDGTGGKKSFDRHTSEECPPSPPASGRRAVSFRQIDNDSNDDVLSVKRTRPNSTRAVSNSRRPPAAMAALSPPQEEPVDESAGATAARLSTPLKSSLKPSSRKVLETPVREDPENDENVFPSANELASPSRSPSKPASRDSSNKGPFDSQPRPQTSAAPKQTSRSKERMDDSDELVRTQRCRSPTSKSDKRPTVPKAMTQIDGSPERPQPPGDLHSVITYQAGPGVKILKAPSTLRSQPKTYHGEARSEPTLARSRDQRTPSRGPQGSESTDDELVKKSGARSSRGKAAPDQMDGAADFMIVGSSCHESSMDLRGAFERRDAVDNQKHSLPVFKVRTQPHAVLTKKNGQPRKPSWSSPRRTTPRSTTKDGRGEARPVASKVRGLAAMFDTAAKASPFVPTPGGVVQKKRRETARVISPYTSNPSPRASVQSTTSVSTPVSLMNNPPGISTDLTNIAHGSGRKSMIPRLQHLSTTDSTGMTEVQITPTPGRRDESRFSLASSNAPSRIPTPSRLPVRSNPSGVHTPSLPQLDGPHKRATKLPLKLTAQQEIRPVGYYSSPIPGTRTSDGYRGLPRLSQHSTTSDFSEGIGRSGESSPLSPNLGRGRSASSLRDQIRSLRAELSAKNEDCAQLRLELEGSRKARQVNEILREDLDRARVDNSKWRRRAEVAERKVDHFERLAMQIKDARDRGHLGGGCRHGQAGSAVDDYSFTSGSDHLDIAEPPPQPLTARMNQSARRTPPASGLGGDGLSECSSSTVVRNVGTGSGEDSAGLWGAVDELVEFAFPGLADERR